jgi:hypothetical protein
VFNNQIYLFHQGLGNDGQLWCNCLSTNGSWSGDTQLSSVSGAFATDGSPSAVVFNGQIYCFYVYGSGVKYVVLDASNNWNAPENVVYPGGNTTYGGYICPTIPAAIVYGGQIYLFFQGINSKNSDPNQLLYCTVSSDGSTWSSVTQVGNATAAAGGNVLAVIGNQVEAIVEPFVDQYLVPSNLANTAILKPTPAGPVWVIPAWAQSGSYSLV